MSNQNQTEERVWKVTKTHILDGISYRECQQLKSNRGAAHDSLAGWEFMQEMSAMEPKQRSCTWLTCWMGVHAGNVSNGTKQRSCTWLTCWMGVHAGNVSNGNQAQELHMTHKLDGSSCRECQQWKPSTEAAHDSLAGWEFIQGILAMETKHRTCTWLTSWMEVHPGNVSNGNQAQDLHMTHILDRSSSRECQQWKSSTGTAHDSQPGWEFM